MFSRLPLWAQIGIGFVALCSLDALFMAWGDRHFFASFALSLIAVILHWILIFGSLLVPIWAGCATAERTRRDWLGWIVGLAVLAGCLELGYRAEGIPGVGWRIEKIIDANADRDWEY